MSIETLPPKEIRSAEDALRLILQVATLKRSDLPCRVDEMSPREYGIFQVTSEYAGGMQYIVELAQRGLSASPPSETQDVIPRDVLETLLTNLQEFEPDNANLVGVNDYSVGHESGQSEAAESIARMVSDLLDEYPAANAQSTPEPKL